MRSNGLDNFTDITYVAGVTDITDIADVTDITDVAGVTDISGGTVGHMASQPHTQNEGMS